MNKQLFYGRELFLKLARPKTRTTGRYAHGYGRGGGFRYDAPLMGGGGGMGGSGGYQSHSKFIGVTLDAMQHKRNTICLICQIKSFFSDQNNIYKKLLLRFV
jgi:hypothetical protein